MQIIEKNKKTKIIECLKKICNFLDWLAFCCQKLKAILRELIDRMEEAHRSTALPEPA